jgi:TPR repeat protein
MRRTLFRYLVLLQLFPAVLWAQTTQEPFSREAKSEQSRVILQSDYDEIVRSAGRIKAEEVSTIEQKATAGDMQSQLLLATLYQQGCGLVNVDTAKELAWLHKAADQGSSIALNQIGIYYEKVAHDSAEALRWYRKAAGYKDAVAQYNIGSMYYEGAGAKRNNAEAAVWLREAVENGNYRDPLTLLLDLYEDGKALPGKTRGENQKEGLTLLMSLVNQDNEEAELILAASYAAGLLGLPRDGMQALQWLRKASEKSALAQANLGYAYSSGQLSGHDIGLPRDEAEAVKWYRKAAESGSTLGMVDLAYMYEHGKGIKKDMAEAVRWYLAAAERRDSTAQYVLGGLYEEGNGVPKDKITSIMWFLLARQSGAPDFMQEIHWNWQFIFHRHPDKGDYDEAKKRADAWREAHYCR